MNSRKDILDLLDYLRNANETNALITPEHKKTNSYRNNLKTICESKSSEEGYIAEYHR